MNQITDGNFVAGSIVKIDTAAQTMFFQGYGREEGINPYYEDLYSVRFDGSRMTHLTPENANHRIFASSEAIILWITCPGLICLPRQL